ncbi:MAG: T9SS type A sorting domain-containing protein [Ignavibacteriales bacterium]|nr:T9SS type A sorting domain-containing protein [Ignavibacteriales bacterium]
MKKFLLITLLLTSASLLFSQTDWNLTWKMKDCPFRTPQEMSEMGIVKSGYDTDQDGKGEFLCAYTDKDSNFIMMFEAVANDSFEMVWYWEYPIPANTFAGITVGDMDNNGVVEIITTMPSVVGSDINPPRLWIFEWNGVNGENKYGDYGSGDCEPTAYWNFNVSDNYDFRPYSLIVEDIDGDLVNELIVGVRQSQPSSRREVLVASVSGIFTGFFTWNVEYNFQYVPGGSLYSVTTGDLDDDNKTEIYVLGWNYFNLRIIECNGDANYSVETELDTVFYQTGIDYGAVDGVRCADVNGDSVNELYIAGTESPNQLFIITNISDVGAITKNDIVPFYSIPKRTAEGGLKSMYIADPDLDGNLSLMIGGERNGQIFDLEYKGTGDPADSTNWELTIAFDYWDESGLPPDSFSAPPRMFYGHPAGDMDGDGKEEYTFVNYATRFETWTGDAYVWVIEAEISTGIEDGQVITPKDIRLYQNYPNPFNPSTTIEYSIPSDMFVSVKVYNTLGQEIKTLVNESQNQGRHIIEFKASELSSGIYFYTLTARSGTGQEIIQTKKMLLLK